MRQSRGKMPNSNMSVKPLNSISRTTCNRRDLRQAEPEVYLVTIYSASSE